LLNVFLVCFILFPSKLEGCRYCGGVVKPSLPQVSKLVACFLQFKTAIFSGTSFRFAQTCASRGIPHFVRNDTLFRRLRVKPAMTILQRGADGFAWFQFIFRPISNKPSRARYLWKLFFIIV